MRRFPQARRAFFVTQCFSIPDSSLRWDGSGRERENQAASHFECTQLSSPSDRVDKGNLTAVFSWETLFTRFYFPLMSNCL